MSEYASSTQFLQSLANNALLETRNARSMIWGLGNANNTVARLREERFRHNVGDPDMVPPKLSDFLPSLSDNTDATMRKLNSDADAWMERYFPAMDECLRTLPEEFLCGVISGVKPFGLDATVFEIIWLRARDRAYRTMDTERRTLEADFTSRGFSIPPGAMVATMADVATKASDAIGEVNREQAIKEAEIKLELLKFAEEQALNYKRGILSALADFYRAWITIPDKDIERARLKVQAMGNLYSALSTYYNVQATFEELKLKAKQTEAEIDLDIDRNRIANTERNKQDAIAAALGQAARAFGDVASQSAASAGSLVAQIENL